MLLYLSSSTDFATVKESLIEYKNNEYFNCSQCIKLPSNVKENNNSKESMTNT